MSTSVSMSEHYNFWSFSPVSNWDWKGERGVIAAQAFTPSASTQSPYSSDVIGYYQDSSSRASWTWAPNREGKAPVGESPPAYWGGSFFPAREITGTDREGRKYVLIRANEGCVPVRHPTDPAVGNWLSPLQRTTTIVYSNSRYRWPSFEGIDYSLHGFRLYEGKSWWPITLGDFQPTLLRSREPYYPEYQTPVAPFPSSSPYACVNAALSSLAGLLTFRAVTGRFSLANLSGDVIRNGVACGGVIAEGAHSLIRDTLHSEPPRYSDLCAYRREIRERQVWILSELDEADSNLQLS